MSNTVFDQFFNDLNVFLSNFAENNDLPKFLSDFKPIINRENGSKIRSDFSLNFVSPKFELWLKYLPQICDQLVIDSKEWNSFSIESSRINHKNNRILLFIKRSTAVPKLLQYFAKYLEAKPSIDEKCLITCALFDVKNQLTAERIRKVSQSVSKLLDTSYVDFDYKAISDEIYERLLSSAQNSRHCESDVNNKLIFRYKCVANGSTVETNGSFDETNTILIDRTSKTTFELIYNLYEFVKDRVKSDSNQTIVIIISETLTYRLRQSFLLMTLLYDLKLNLKLIPVSTVNTDHTFDDYMQILSDKLMDQNDSSFESTGIDLLIGLFRVFN